MLAAVYHPWIDSEVEVIPANDTDSVSFINNVFWDLDDFECFSGKRFDGDFIPIGNGEQQSRVAGSESNF